MRCVFSVQCIIANEILEKFLCREPVFKSASLLLCFTTLLNKFIQACLTTTAKQSTTVFFVQLMFLYLIATTKKVKLLDRFVKRTWLIYRFLHTKFYLLSGNVLSF